MLKTSSVVLSFIVCSNRNRSALVCDLLCTCNYSQFVGQLYEDKSLLNKTNRKNISYIHQNI